MPLPTATMCVSGPDQLLKAGRTQHGIVFARLKEGDEQFQSSFVPLLTLIFISLILFLTVFSIETIDFEKVAQFFAFLFLVCFLLWFSPE